MSDDFEKAMAEAVRELNLSIPSWRSKLDPDRLNMELGLYSVTDRHSCGCVLAQLHASMAKDSLGSYYSFSERWWRDINCLSVAFIAPDNLDDEGISVWEKRTNAAWKSELAEVAER